MLQIQDTLVSLDMIEKFFVCNLDACLGECCIEGDEGAPLTAEEDARLKELMPDILPLLSPAARRVIEEEGASYLDREGELVTQIIEGKNCVYTCFDPNGKCLCALVKARSAGDGRMFKPVSCALYPARVKQYDGFAAVNYHRWKICKAAEVLGRAQGVRAYEFLKEPLVRRFGQDWYDELDFTAKEYLRQNPDK